MKRTAINAISFALIAFIGKKISSYFVYSSYINWVLSAFLVTLSALIIVILFNYIFYRDFFKNLPKLFKKKR